MNSFSLIAKFSAFLKQQLKLPPDARLLLAVSGGVDSMVMVDLVAKGGWDFGIAHCNFKLRGMASDEDAELVRKTAPLYEVPFYSESFQPKTMAAEKGISVQMAARQQRYEWLEKIRGTKGFDWIATAHHLDDQAETMLLNLTKGTGIRGLHGISPKSGTTIRPLLFAEKAELQAYAQQENLNWREDLSNESDEYQRNYVRHHVIPALKAINPSFFQTMNANAQRFSAVEAEWNDALKTLWTKTAKAHGQGWHLDKKPLMALVDPVPYLYDLLTPFGFHENQIQDLVKALSREPGKLFYSPSHVLEVSRETLLLYPLEEEKRERYQVIEPDQTTVKFEDQVFQFMTQAEIDWNECQQPRVACIDRDLVQYPLTLRHWQEGDYFYPLGMNHSKKLSDFFVDEKFSRLQKAKALVLESQGEIVWIIGDRMDNRFRITENTTRVLKITVEKA